MTHPSDLSDIYIGNGVVLRVEQDTRRVHYCYWPAWDIGCDFDLLCEVGEPWQEPFRQLIAHFGLEIELYDSGPNFYERIH